MDIVADITDIATDIADIVNITEGVIGISYNKAQLKLKLKVWRLWKV